MRTADATGWALRPSSRLVAAISVLVALAIGSAPLVALVAMGGE